MSDDISKQRSPNAPSITLEHAIELTKKLYTAIRNASVKPEVAAKSLGYSGINGAALTTLGAISQYDLINRSRGMVAVAKEAVTILHPISESEKQSAIKTLALSPRIFGEINQRFHDCAPSVIESFLIHERFSPEKAQKVASIYAENVKFANLSGPGSVPDEAALNPGLEIAEEIMRQQETRKTGFTPPKDFLQQSQTENKVLAQYTIPLGANQATLVFTGEQLAEGDFDALADFVEFSKKQFLRAQKTQKKTIEEHWDETEPAPPEDDPAFR